MTMMMRKVRRKAKVRTSSVPSSSTYLSGMSKKQVKTKEIDINIWAGSDASECEMSRLFFLSIFFFFFSLVTIRFSEYTFFYSCVRQSKGGKNDLPKRKKTIWLRIFLSYRWYEQTRKKNICLDREIRIKCKWPFHLISSGSNCQMMDEISNDQLSKNEWNSLQWNDELRITGTLFFDVYGCIWKRQVVDRCVEWMNEWKGERERE